MYIGVDFDGTVVDHAFPNIGSPVPDAIRVLKRLQEAGHNLILFTMRSGEKLQEAVDYMYENGINLFGINTNPTQISWTNSPKAYCNIYIDDAALGAPLEKIDGFNRHSINWSVVEEFFFPKSAEEVMQELCDEGVIKINNLNATKTR